MNSGKEHIGAGMDFHLELMAVPTSRVGKPLHMSPTVGLATGTNIEGMATGSSDAKILIKWDTLEEASQVPLVELEAMLLGVIGKACQIFVRNLPFDLIWKMLNNKFNECGHVLYTDIKMKNGKSRSAV